jgi:hypothetical protein
MIGDAHKDNGKRKSTAETARQTPNPCLVLEDRRETNPP